MMLILSQEEKEARRREENKRELERKRAAKLEEERRQAEERRLAEQQKASEAKGVAQKQAAEQQKADAERKNEQMRSQNSSKPTPADLLVSFAVLLMTEGVLMICRRKSAKGRCMLSHLKNKNQIPSDLLQGL